MTVLYVGIFGLLGVYARYFAGLWAGKYLIHPFPYVTIAINVIGSFLIGLVYVLGFEKSLLSSELRVGIMVGFLGGFTTFSAYCLEIGRLIEMSEYGYAAAYLVLSSLLGILATFAGFYLARMS